jgi:hypothetical protein
MTKKKEDPKKVKARVDKYLKTHSQILITGLSISDKEAFSNIKGLEGLSYSKKLCKLIEFWNEHNNKDLTPKPIVNINDKKKVTKTKKLDFSEKEFLDFLFDFKATNKNASGLRRNGKAIREKLKQNSVYENLFTQLFQRLPAKVSKSFNKMFLEGYFNLLESDLKSIVQEKEDQMMCLLLLETLKFINKDNAFLEAKKEIKKKLKLS